MRKKIKSPTKMPKTIYVTWGDFEDGSEPYLVAELETDPVEDGAAVGIYELRQVRRKVVKHELA